MKTKKEAFEAAYKAKKEKNDTLKKEIKEMLEMGHEEEALLANGARK